MAVRTNTGNSGFFGNILNATVINMRFDDTCFVSNSANDYTAVVIGIATGAMIVNVSNEGQVVGCSLTAGIIGGDTRSIILNNTNWNPIL